MLKHGMCGSWSILRPAVVMGGMERICCWEYVVLFVTVVEVLWVVVDEVAVRVSRCGSVLGRLCEKIVDLSSCFYPLSINLVSVF
jgi:hypothetical protein